MLPPRVIDTPSKSMGDPPITLCGTPIMLYTPPMTLGGAPSVIDPASGMSGDTSKEMEQMKTITSALRLVLGACRAWLIGSPQNTDFAQPKSVTRRAAWCHLPSQRQDLVRE